MQMANIRHLSVLLCFFCLKVSSVGFPGDKITSIGELTPQEQISGIEKKFQEELQVYLAANLRVFSSWSIAEIRLGQPKSGTKDTQHYIIDVARPMILNIPFAYVPITINSSRGKLKTALTVRLNLKRIALVAQKDIAVNVDLRVSDFAAEEIDAVGIRGEVISVPEEVTRYRAKMYIKSGACLTNQMVRPKAIIKHGNPVTCYIRTGSVLISIDCIARDDGCMGDIIRVMSKEKKLYRAKIESAESAKIVD